MCVPVQLNHLSEALPVALVAAGRHTLRAAAGKMGRPGVAGGGQEIVHIGASGIASVAYVPTVGTDLM
jgi:hypothetical protein